MLAAFEDDLQTRLVDHFDLIVGAKPASVVTRTQGEAIDRMRGILQQIGGASSPSRSRWVDS